MCKAITNEILISTPFLGFLAIKMNCVNTCKPTYAKKVCVIVPTGIYEKLSKELSETNRLSGFSGLGLEILVLNAENTEANYKISLNIVNDNSIKSDLIQNIALQGADFIYKINEKELIETQKKEAPSCLENKLKELINLN